MACVPGLAWLLYQAGLSGGWAVIASFSVLLLLDKLFNFGNARPDGATKRATAAASSMRCVPVAIARGKRM